jgi:hypothetical protein
MGEQFTLRHPETGHTVVTDNPELISNLHYGRGYKKTPLEPARPDPNTGVVAVTAPDSEPAPDHDDPDGPASAAAALRVGRR